MDNLNRDNKSTEKPVWDVRNVKNNRWCAKVAVALAAWIGRIGLGGRWLGLHPSPQQWAAAVVVKPEHGGKMARWIVQEARPVPGARWFAQR